MKKYVVVALAYFIPLVSLAHTKWFADGDLASYHTTEPTVLYLALWASVTVIVVGIGCYLERQALWQLVWLKPKTTHSYDRAAATFAMVVGAFLLIAGTHEYLFSPNQSIHTGVPVVLVIVQILIGLAFLIGVATRSAALVLMFVWVISIATCGPVSAVENMWVLSTAVFIAIMGNDYFSLLGKSFFKKKLERYKPYALSTLRIGVGVTLFILGFSEKILAPEYGMNFLTHYHWNFMALAGFQFSDYAFVLSAGVVESLFGLVFMLGIVTRLNALVTAIVFTIPLFILGPIELAGHLPHFAAIVVLLFFGSGGKFVLIKSKPKPNTVGN
jgi:uncharacterized membrane protein YphA (DoxX/SURF4 family)